ncbi:hypothetical protein [Tsukamurella tyrosinosolvens]|uniref:hypothetical protein n=1 Tax=Tsukamurella tyrosinosolvens TaxID=57704 RepID=UPI0034633B99
MIASLVVVGWVLAAFFTAGLFVGMPSDDDSAEDLLFEWTLPFLLMLFVWPFGLAVYGIWWVHRGR